MKKTAILLAIAIGVVLAGLAQTGTAKYALMFTPNPMAPTAAAVANGKTLFVENCATCHGDNGRGRGPSAQDIPRRVADLTRTWKSDGFLAAHITYGKRDYMPAWQDILSEEQIWELVIYINELRTPDQGT